MKRLIAKAAAILATSLVASFAIVCYWPAPAPAVVHLPAAQTAPIEKRPLAPDGTQLNQAAYDRAPIMRTVLPKHFAGRAIRAVEIGPWCGLGSTKIWLETIGDGSELFLIDAWRPYATPEDKAVGNDTIERMGRMMRDAMASTFDVVSRAEQSRPSLRITMVRAKGAEFLTNIAAGSVDFVYVDGSHYYDDVVADLRQAKRVARDEFAMICGDDLEQLPTPELLSLAKKYRQADWIDGTKVAGCPASFHPGVLVAINEEFPAGVAMDHGFWWAIRKNGKWVAAK